MKPTFFATPADFRGWLEEHHESATELVVGYMKRVTGVPSVTWPESVDEALCFGWIDGVRKSLDETSYVIRFTPRKPKSNWSAVNVRRALELTRLGRMRPAGRKAFAARVEEKTGVYSFEQREAAKLDAADEKRFRANQPAWEFFQAQAPWYRKVAVFWVMSAKKEETRQRRLATLIDDSSQGRIIGPLKRPPADGKKKR
jgi:uncharacterized protein YdeI (YjbR/CyaY-like superfamily)